MYKNPVMNFHVNTDIRPLPVDPNYFKLKKRNKFTRWLMRMLKKLNILENRVEYENVQNIQKVEVDLVKLHDFLMREMYYFMERNIAIERVLLGRSQYDLFLQGDLTHHINIPYNESTAKFMGVPVQLNPFIDGIVFVPRDRW